MRCDAMRCDAMRCDAMRCDFSIKTNIILPFNYLTKVYYKLLKSQYIFHILLQEIYFCK